MSRSTMQIESKAALQTEIERHMREKVALAGLVMKEREENERLQAALEPFAAIPNLAFEKAIQGYITLSNVQQARRALGLKP